MFGSGNKQEFNLLVCLAHRLLHSYALLCRHSCITITVDEKNTCVNATRNIYRRP